MSVLDDVLRKTKHGGYDWCSDPDCVVCPRQREEIERACKELKQLRSDPIKLPAVIQIDTVSGKVMDEDGKIIAIVRDSSMTLNVELVAQHGGSASFEETS